MRSARDLFELTLGEPLQATSRLVTVDSPEFRASVQTRDGDIRISTGVVRQLDDLWSRLLETTVLTEGPSFERIAADGISGLKSGRYADHSLVWLCLHELMHLHLGHRTLLGGAELVEVGSASEHTYEQAIDPASVLDENELPHMHKCLEMQADSEATDFFIGLFSESRYREIRVLAVAVFAVMVLIERENLRLGTGNITHPAAGTRFFTLMGHLFQMWSYPGAWLEPDDVGSRIRSAEPRDAAHFEAYSQAVLVPLVHDAVMVATFAEAKRFIIDMGDKSALFRDIFKVQYADELKPEILATYAAKEWLTLMPINHKLLTFLQLT